MTSLVLWCHQKRRYLLPISILYTTMLSKQGYICCSIAKVTLLVVVLLRQYYSSYNIANSRCSGLKTIGSTLFVSENCQSNTLFLEYHWSKVISYNVFSAICPSVMLLNQTWIHSCGCYLVSRSLRLFCIMLFQWFVPLWCCWIKLEYIHVDVIWYKVA